MDNECTPIWQTADGAFYAKEPQHDCAQGLRRGSCPPLRSHRPRHRMIALPHPHQSHEMQVLSETHGLPRLQGWQKGLRFSLLPLEAANCLPSCVQSALRSGAQRPQEHVYLWEANFPVYAAEPRQTPYYRPISLDHNPLPIGATRRKL